jgi:hypothetical protein
MLGGFQQNVHESVGVIMPPWRIRVINRALRDQNQSDLQVVVPPVHLLQVVGLKCSIDTSCGTKSVYAS